MSKANNDLKKPIIIIIISALAYLLVNNLSLVGNILNTLLTVLKPFILGGVIAFILNIPMTKIENLLKKDTKNKNGVMRIVSIVLSLILLIAIVSVVAFLLIPELVENIQLLITNIPGFLEKTQNWIFNLFNEYPDIQVKIQESFTETGNLNDIISTILNYVVDGAIGLVSGLVSGVVTIFTAIIFAIYALSSKEYLIRGTKKIVYSIMNKEHANKVIEVGNLANKTFNKFISGQCLEAVILGVLIFISMSLFRLPYALIIAVLTAVTALIPIFGAFIAMIIGVILISVINPFQAVIFAVIFLVVQQIEGNFIYPRVVGKSVGLSPMWTLLSITVFGNLFGIVGMLVGLPLASVVYAVFKGFVNDRLDEKNIKVV